MNSIKYQDFEKILRYAKIYGLANGREDILNRYSMLRKMVGKRAPDSEIQLNEKDGEVFGSLCLYAVASAGSAGDEIAHKVCNIAQEHSAMLTPYDRASAMAVTDLLKDPRKGDGCPFYQLYKYLEEGGCGTENPQDRA